PQLHGPGDHRHVVHHGREHADGNGDAVDVAQAFLEQGRHLNQVTGAGQRGDSEQDAEEEQNDGDVDTAQYADYRQRVLLFAVLAAVDDFGGDPQHAETEEDAHVWRQMGDGLEDRHEDQRTQAEAEHQVAFERGGRVAAALGALLDAWLGHVAIEAETHDQQRYQQADQAGQEQLGDDAGGGHLITDPQHGGGDVANRRPGAAGVGGDDHDTGVEPAFVHVCDQFAQQRDHHDGGGQVVQCG